VSKLRRIKKHQLLRYRYSLEIRHTRVHVPLFRLSLTARISAVILSSGKENLLTYNNSLDRSPDESGCFASSVVRRRLREIAPPGQL
jgi:hypothetical protein